MTEYKCKRCGAPTRPNCDGDTRYEPPKAAKAVALPIQPVELSQIERMINDMADTPRIMEKIRSMLCVGTNTDDEVERVAIAICPWYGLSKAPGRANDLWEGSTEPEKRAYREQAKAAISAMSPVRESVEVMPGDLIKGHDHQGEPIWCVAVPYKQMVEIHERLRKLTKLGQTHVDDFIIQSSAEAKLKQEIFCEAEWASILAGNWTQRKPPTTEIEGQEGGKS